MRERELSVESLIQSQKTVVSWHLLLETAKTNKQTITKKNWDKERIKQTRKIHSTKKDLFITESMVFLMKENLLELGKFLL